MNRPEASRSGKASDTGAGLTIGSLSHVGMVRTSNQDECCALLSPQAPRGCEALISVADGMGGHKGGDVASKLAIQSLVQVLEDGIPKGEPEARLRQTLEQVNAKVYSEAANLDLRGMGTTLTVALIAHGIATIAHVGDSRGYLWRNGELQQITHDHSWVAEQVEAGLLQSHEAQNHPRRNIVTRGVGLEAHVQVDTTSVIITQGDVLLLCSDGLHSLVTDEEIAKRLVGQDPQETCQSLVDLANNLGGKDNITVVVARVDGLKK